MAGDPAAATEGWSALIQVVRYDERRSREPDLELAVVMKGPSDAFTLRRVSLAGGDLCSSLPLLLDVNPADLRGLGRDRPIQVEDQAFDRAEDALDAAHAQPPLADPEGWIPEAEFRSLVENDPDILDALAPRAERDGSLGHNVGVLAGFAGFLAVVLGGVVVGDQFGLYTPERQDTLWDNVLGVGLFCLAGVVAVLVYRLVVRLFARAGRRRDMRSQEDDHDADSGSGAVTPTPTIELPLTLSLNPLQRAGAALIYVGALAGAWGALHYLRPGSWDVIFGLIACVAMISAGIHYAVSSITLDQDAYTEVAAWRIETVPLSGLVEVRHHDDVVELVALGGGVKVIGPLSDEGRNTPTHGLPAGATAAGVAAAIEEARRNAPDRPPKAPGRRLPPGYPWAALAAGVLLVRVLTLWAT